MTDHPLLRAALAEMLHSISCYEQECRDIDRSTLHAEFYTGKTDEAIAALGPKADAMERGLEAGEPTDWPAFARGWLERRKADPEAPTDD